MFWKLRGKIPGQQLVDASHGMVSDALLDMAQVDFRVQLVQFGGAKQAIDGGCAYSAVVRRQFIVPEFWHAKSRSHTRFTHSLTRASSFRVNTSTTVSPTCSFVVRTERRIYFQVGWPLPKQVP